MSTSELLNRLEEAKGIKWKPLSASGYELYTFSWEKGPEAAEKKKKSKAAAVAINKAMKAIASEIGKLVKNQDYNEEWWAKKLGQLSKKHIEPLYSEFSESGISDTEPRYNINQGMIDMVKNWYGIQGFTKLGDWL